MPLDLAMCPGCKAAMMPSDQVCGRCGHRKSSGSPMLALLIVSVALAICAVVAVTLL
jgi:hypothetical protein